jgi:hypothetical protein
MSENAPPPASVADCLGNAGPAHVLRFRGAAYPVHAPTPAAVARVERLIVRRAMDSLEELREVYSPAEWAAEQDALRVAVRTREHRPGGRLWNAEMQADGAGRSLVYVLWAGLTEAADLPFEVAQAMLTHAPDEAMLAVAAVLPDFTSRVAERLGQPPAKATALRAKAEAEAEAIRRRTT